MIILRQKEFGIVKAANKAVKKRREAREAFKYFLERRKNSPFPENYDRIEKVVQDISGGDFKDAARNIIKGRKKSINIPEMYKHKDGKNLRGHVYRNAKQNEEELIGHYRKRTDHSNYFVSDNPKHENIPGVRMNEHSRYFEDPLVIKSRKRRKRFNL